MTGNKLQIIKLLSRKIGSLELQSGKSKISTGIIYIINGLFNGSLKASYRIHDIRKIELHIINFLIQDGKIEEHLKSESFNPADIICPEALISSCEIPPHIIKELFPSANKCFE